MSQWHINVGNVGTTLTTTNGFLAIKEFNEWVKVSKTENGRTVGEPVTLFRDGELYREYNPDDGWFFVEITDTFDGDPNYCWANRYKVKARRHRGALVKVNYATGWMFEYDISDEYDTKRFNLHKACVCAFVSRWSTDAHNLYSNVKIIE